MNAELLLSHFDRISDAPDAVPRLRRFVLDLAVRGKLVEQEPGDDPAANLLKRIRSEKASLVREGTIRRDIPAKPIEAGEEPFPLPAKWEWVRLIDILIKLTDGTHHSPPNLAHGEFRYVTAKNIKPEGVSLDEITYVSGDVHREVYSRCNPEKGDILYIKDGATTGIVTINNLDDPFTMLSSVALLKLPKAVFNRLIVEFLRSPFFYMQMRGFMKGAAITRVTLKRMAPALIPLPPLAEQRRIVAKVDELMGLCDRLEAAQRERESRRDQLAASTHHHLNDGADAEALRSHTQFFIVHLPRLTARPDQVKQLRQSILNLAVRGKLVVQDSKDEPAFQLLKRANSQTVRGSAAKKADEGSHNSPHEDLGPFLIPGNWVWTSLGEVCSKTGSGSTPRGGKEVYQKAGVPFLRSQNIYNEGLRLEDVAYIDQETQSKMSGTAVEPNDLLLNITGGSIGRCCVVPSGAGLANVSQHVAIIRVAVDGIQGYLHRLILSPYFQEAILAEQTGAGRGGLPKNRMDRIPVALPPLAEQHRIVAKVDELMGLCDQLESRLTTAQTEAARLLESVLHHALLPPGLD